MSREKSSKRRKNDQPSLVAEWRTWFAGKSPVFRFGLKFGLLMAVLYILLALPWCDRMLFSYLQANAWLTNLILNCLGQHSHVSGVTISSSQFAMSVQRGCDAVEPTWLFCAAVVSFPATWRRKLMGILMGMVVLQVLNVVRLVTLFLIHIHAPTLFDSAHLEIWPVIFIVVAILLFVGWRGWSDKEISGHAT